jgi:tRNA A58 N-methylase Trm61
VGCGLGFLSCVSAEFYKNALITGINTFEHACLKRSSAKRAKENVRILGFSDRINFKSGDVFRITSSEKFDISSLTSCFITLGRCDLKPTPGFRHGRWTARLS